MRVPTLDGEVSLNIPPGSTGGRALRLKGKGLPVSTGAAATSSSRPRIVLPEGNDPELEALMRKWRDEKPYDPRKDME